MKHYFGKKANIDGYNSSLIFLIPYTRENNLIPPTHFVVESDVKPEKHISYRFFTGKNRNDIPTAFFYGDLGPKLMTPLSVYTNGDDNAC